MKNAAFHNRKIVFIFLTFLLFYCVLTIQCNAQSYITKVEMMDGTNIKEPIFKLLDTTIVFKNYPPYAVSEISIIKVRSKMALVERPVVLGLAGGFFGFLIGRNNYVPYEGPGQYSFYSGFSSAEDINKNLQEQAALKGFGVGMLTGAVVGFATAFITKKVKINGDLARYQKHNKRKLQKYVIK